MTFFSIFDCRFGLNECFTFHFISGIKTSLEMGGNWRECNPTYLSFDGILKGAHLHVSLHFSFSQVPRCIKENVLL